VTGAAVLLWNSRAPEVSVIPPAAPTTPITVEVLNAVGVDGLARAVTMRLRERGLDVVAYGNAGMDTLSVTQVLARVADTMPARVVQEQLGVGDVKLALDPKLLLDVSVLLGRDVVDSTLRP
jgi:calcineurin-like phosphoesterase